MNDLRTGPRRLRAGALLLALALAACRDEGRLSNELSDRYGTAIVGVPDSVSGNMVVTFLSSPFADRPDAEPRGTARRSPSTCVITIRATRRSTRSPSSS